MLEWNSLYKLVYPCVCFFSVKKKAWVESNLLLLCVVNGEAVVVLYLFLFLSLCVANDVECVDEVAGSKSKIIRLHAWIMLKNVLFVRCLVKLLAHKQTDRAEFAWVCRKKNGAVSLPPFVISFVRIRSFVYSLWNVNR